MKIPVWIDLRSASSTLYQFGGIGMFVEDANVGLGAVESSGPVAPLQIETRTSLKREKSDWDKEAIFCRSNLVVSPSALPTDSSLIFLTSREICNDRISGNLSYENERLWIV